MYQLLKGNGFDFMIQMTTSTYISIKQ